VVEVLEVKLAKNMEDFLISRIRQAKKRLWIVSPWISPEYVDILIEKYKEGVDVRVFTTDDTLRSHLESLGKLIYVERVLEKPGHRRLRVLSIVLTLLGGVLSLANLLFLAFLVIGLLLFSVSRNKYRKSYKCVLGDEALHVYKSKPGRILHAKIYVVDEAVALGSVNFTKTSILNNVEALAWINDKSIAESLLQEIMNLGRNYGLEKMLLKEIAGLLGLK